MAPWLLIAALAGPGLLIYGAVTTTAWALWSGGGVIVAGLFGVVAVLVYVVARLKLARDDEARRTQGRVGARFEGLMQAAQHAERKARELERTVDSIRATLRLQAQQDAERSFERASELLEVTVQRRVQEEARRLRAELRQELERSDHHVAVQIATVRAGIDRALARAQSDRVADREHANEGLRRAEQAIRERLERLETLMEKRTERAERLDETLRRRTERVEKQVRDGVGKIETSAREIETVKAQSSRIARRLDRERSDRILSLARRDNRGRELRRCVLILCPPRTGSTWLFDAMRCHPMVEFEPLTTIIRRLGIDRMNRYPHGLSNAHAGESTPGDVGVEVELAPQRGEIIPAFEPTPEIAELGAGLGVEPCSIEKLHPEFFDWDVGRFVEHIEQLERDDGVHVDLVYRLRDPRHALRSMVMYKRRDPKWYARLAEDEIPRYFRRSLRAIAELAERRPGFVARYEEQRADPAGALASLFEWIWPEADAETQRAIAEHATARTTREKRRTSSGEPGASGSTFFGDRTSEETSSDGAEAELWSGDAARDVEECVRVYESVLTGAESAAESPVVETKIAQADTATT